MKLTDKQLREIECLNYFTNKNIKYQKLINEKVLNFSAKIIEDINGISSKKAYFLITQDGVKNIIVKDKENLLKLLDTKKWRLRMIDIWEQGVLEGTTPYYTLLGFEENNKIPLSVMKFMAKTMFKGYDKEVIEDIYYNNGDII